jgi:hypothetical protein
MGDSIEYCDKCENNVGCHLNRGCLQLESLYPSDATACSAVATIRRHKYPHEYSGWSVEHDSPRWTSDRLDAAPVPLEILVSELNKIAARETNIWAVVYPQNERKE